MSGTNVLSSNSETVYVRPNRSIGDLTMDVTISERHEDEVEITEHPVEQGAAVTDHAFVKLARLTIEAGTSDSGGSSTGDRRCVEAYEALLKLLRAREPFTVVTGKRIYENMLIRSLSVTTDEKTENVLHVRAELQEILIVSVQTVAIPASRQKYGSKTGAVQEKGQKQAEPTSKSALASLFG